MRNVCTPMRRTTPFVAAAFASLFFAPLASASEAKLIMPDLSTQTFLGVDGHSLLLYGLGICVLGLLFGLFYFIQLKNLAVHKSMLEVSELIYATCKTYLLTQGKFLLLLWIFITASIVAYFGFLAEYADPITGAISYGFPASKVMVVVLFSLIGMAGSFAVAWFGIRVNTFANSRTSHAALAGFAYPLYSIPLRAGMSIGMVLISIELLIMLCIILFLPASLAGPCFIGFAIGESLGAAALRVAGGIFTKIADIGADLMKIVFKIKEDDARNPGVIADCVGDNAGDSVGPSADGFETYGVTGVALISFILLAITPAWFLPKDVTFVDPQVFTTLTTMNPADRTLSLEDPRVQPLYAAKVAGAKFLTDERDIARTAGPKIMSNDQPIAKAALATSQSIQVKLLVWIFAMRLLMVVTSALAYFLNESVAKARFGNKRNFNFEAPLTSLIWVASILSIAATFVASYYLIHDFSVQGQTFANLWWKLATIITCGTLAGAVIPEVTKAFTSTSSKHVREVVAASREGGASLNILSGLTAGNFSAFWVGGVTITGLMAIAYLITLLGTPETGMIGSIMPAPAIFAFGLVAFGFLGMGPVTIAVDSYGPVTDNAQSVYELSLIESQPNIRQDLKQNFNMDADFEQAKQLLEENDGAGNTFKATAKPVLIGTAVVGATTMVFSIIMVLTDGLTANIDKLSILHAPFLLGMIMGAAMIYWFSGASCQAVITGAYRAVEFIKENIKLDENSEKASVEDSKKVVAICTQYAQKGMVNIFLTVFFLTLATAFTEEYFFIGFLIAVAIVGLFQAVFMANAGGAWDNAKKIVETELRMKGTPLHDAAVVGDTVGDPFKDTSSVALNPIIKFTTLFGLLAVELAITLTGDYETLRHFLAAVFFLVAFFFIYRSFYGMRIKSGEA